MKLTLIGMSNVGKTYWSKKLEQAGFIRFGCDDLLAEGLVRELKRKGFKTIHDVADWMGQPYEVRYQQTSSLYLQLEEKALSTILNRITHHGLARRNVVIDTTGSVIYLAPKLLALLKEKTTVVYLETSHSMQQEMFKRYLENPKPVIWGESFQKRADESRRHALARCYPQLLNLRTREYKRYADFRLDYFLLRNKGFSNENFLQGIKQAISHSSGKQGMSVSRTQNTYGSGLAEMTGIHRAH